MAMFTVTMEGDRQLVSKLVAAPERVRMALKRQIQVLALKLQKKVQADHLSGPTGPHTLNVKTGALRRSVFQQVVDTAEGTTGIVGFSADVPYAAIHEFGGEINIPEIVPTKARALHFIMGGQDVFAKRVAPHKVTMPARAPLQTAFNEMKDEIVTSMEAAVKEAIHSA